MYKTLKLTIGTILIILLVSNNSYATSGRKDSSGCHTSKSSGYHCHGGSVNKDSPSTHRNINPPSHNSGNNKSSSTHKYINPPKSIYELDSYKDDTESLNNYDEVIKLNRADAEVWFKRAEILVRLERYTDATDSYDHAINIKPDFIAAWYHRGIVFAILEQYHEAIASFDKVLELDPSNLKARESKKLATEQWQTK